MIQKILDISIAHIQPTTAEWIDARYDDDFILMYPKGEYGWFIHASEELSEQIPADLVAVIQYAKSIDCTWVVLDRDAETISELPQFNWQ